MRQSSPALPLTHFVVPMKTNFLAAVASQACLATIAFSLTQSDIFPPVILDNGTFFGLSDGVTHRFLGIPFAEPP